VAWGKCAERKGRGTVDGSDDAMRNEMPGEYIVLNQGAGVLELWRVPLTPVAMGLSAHSDSDIRSSESGEGYFGFVLI